MLTSQQFTEIKAKSPPQDALKSVPRVVDDFKALTAQQKTEIAELSGVAKNTIYNFARSQKVTAKAILAMAQMMNISPYYYLGTTDEKEPYTKKQMKKFVKEFDVGLTFEKRKYSKKGTAETENATSENTENPQENDIVPTQKDDELVIISSEECDCECCGESEEVIEINIEVDGSEKMKNAVENLDEEDAVILLMALFKKAEANDEAAGLCEIVKYCLLA